MRASGQLSQPDGRRLLTVEGDQAERGEPVHQRRQIVGRSLPNSAVEAACPLRLCHGVPQCDPMADKRFQSRIIVESNEVDADYAADQLPELILRMCIVFLIGQ